MVYIKIKVIIAKIVLVLYLTIGLEAGANVATQTTDDDVLYSLRSFYPGIVDVSPDGSLLLFRTKDTSANGEILVIKRKDDNSVLSEMSFEGPVLRIRWRPDGKQISYFLQQKGTNLRHLYVWDLESGKHRELKIPPSYAQAEVRWSPKGDKLAFISSPSGLVIIEPLTGKIVVLEKAIQAFDWRNDGNQIVLIEKEKSDSVIIIDAKTGERTNELVVKDRMQLREAVWQNSEDILVRGFNSTLRKAALVVIRPDKDEQNIILYTGDEISEIAWLDKGTKVAWGRREGSDRSVTFADRASMTTDVFKFPGSLTIHRIDDLSKSVYAWQVSPAVYQMIRFSPGDHSSLSIVSSHRGTDREGIRHSPIILDGKNGRKFSIWLSEVSKKPEQKRAGVVFVYGGNNINISPERWAETQLLLKQGITVLHVASERPNGPDNIGLSCEYLHNACGIPKERTVVVAVSSPTEDALGAIQAYPGAIGILVLVGATGAPRPVPQGEHVEETHLRVLAFHGEKDKTIAPETARKIIEGFLGKESLVPPHGVWHVFPGEDHALHLDGSRAFVMAAILDALASPDW
jgi:hypothetical protein